MYIKEKMNKNDFLKILITRTKQNIHVKKNNKRIFNVKINRLEKNKLKYRIQKKIIKLPLRIDLRKKCQPILDQGNLGSCTANALVSIVGYDKKNLFGSRLFLYYNERMLINTIPDDSGAYLSDGIKILQTYGICQESSWPYDISKFTDKPPNSCYEEALEKDREIKDFMIENEIEYIGIPAEEESIKLIVEDIKKGNTNQEDECNEFYCTPTKKRNAENQEVITTSSEKRTKFCDVVTIINNNENANELNTNINMTINYESPCDLYE
jgi:hypothetical protein